MRVSAIAHTANIKTIWANGLISTSRKFDQHTYRLWADPQIGGHLLSKCVLQLRNALLLAVFIIPELVRVGLERLRKAKHRSFARLMPLVLITVILDGAHAG